MRYVGAALALVACLLVRPVAAEIPDKYLPAVDAANGIGEQIYLHDVAASLATDELLRRHVVPTDRRVRGWLTDADARGSSHGMVVTFIGDVAGSPMALYRVRIQPGDAAPGYEALASPAALDPSQLARWKARAAAMTALQGRKDRCADQYNTVVLPAGTAGITGIRVYLFAATSTPDLMVAGGHFLYEYSSDGAKLLKQRAFSKACMDISLKEDPDKGRLAALTLTHLLDPTPTEVHVFLSRNYRQTLFIGTTQNSLVWVIQEGTIIMARPLDSK